MFSPTQLPSFLLAVTTMETKRSSRASRVTTQGKAAAAKTVSASSIFKKPPNIQKVQKKVRRVPSPKASNSPSKKQRSTSHKGQALHPLAVAFEDATSDYRNTLLAAGTKALNKSHAALVNALHECNLVELSSPAASTTKEGHASPVRLTLSASFDRKQQKLFNPIGAYQLRSRVANAAGEKEVVDTTLNEMLMRFEERYLKDAEQLGELQQQWETVVGEIWKTGVNYLGEDAMMEQFLARKSAATTSPSQAHLNTEPDETSLFIPEHSPQRSRTGKKRVSFQEPRPALPTFLTAPSRLQQLPRPPDPPRAEMDALRKTVRELGKEHFAEMKTIDREYQKFWERKLGSMRRAVEDDE